jgi:hypothetical protein
MYAKGLTTIHAAWQHPTITNTQEFPREMRMTFIDQSTKRPGAASCFVQGIGLTVANYWSFSGRAAD